MNDKLGTQNVYRGECEPAGIFSLNQQSCITWPTRWACYSLAVCCCIRSKFWMRKQHPRTVIIEFPSDWANMLVTSLWALFTYTHPSLIIHDAPVQASSWHPRSDQTIGIDGDMSNQTYTGCNVIYWTRGTRLSQRAEQIVLWQRYWHTNRITLVNKHGYVYMLQ